MNFVKKGATAALLAAATGAHAQIATDGSVGARVSFTGRDMVIPESLGLRVGINLLHSFSVFNVGTGQSATFAGTGFVQNIIARITGGSASQIDGTVASSIPGSNLFLINPSGIVFGPNAAIDVPGSFHASTAHYLKLADGTRIAMTGNADVTLTFAAPSAFGFEGTAAPITVQGAQLHAAQGGRISLAGGDITIDAFAGNAASVVARSGTIGIAAVRSAGEVAIEANGLRAQGFTTMGDVTVRGSLVSVSEGFEPFGNGAGAISIEGRNVTLDHSRVDASTIAGPSRGVRVDAAGTLSANASAIVADTFGAGDAGPITLTARDIALSNGAIVDTSCEVDCSGAGAPIVIRASGRFTLAGDSPDTATYVVSNSFGSGRTGTIRIEAGEFAASDNAKVQAIALSSGDGSSIDLVTGSIALTGGAQVDVSTRGSGHGGTLHVANSGAIRVEGTRIENAETGQKSASGFYSNASASGAAGAILISTGSLDVLGGGEISSSSARGASAAGGRIEIAATGAVRVSGTDSDLKSSAIISNTFTSANAGDVDITADALHIDGRGRIQVQSEGAGNAGTARIRVREMSLASQGQVSSDTRLTGNGGSLDIAVRETLTIDGGDSGLFAKTYDRAPGGSIALSAGDIRLTNDGGIFAGTDGSGRGGDLFINAARNIDIASAGSISVESRVDGLAGSIDVHAGDTLTMTTAGAITTAARLADGGDIRVSAGRAGFIDGARIETEVGSGQGSGGNVDLRIPTFVMRTAVITANAFGGNGGNIRIGTTTFIPSADSRITASSTLGIDGTITLESPALDPTGELLIPPPAFVDAGAVLAGRCGPRLAGRASSLVIAPRAAADAPDGWRFAMDQPRAPWLQPLACMIAAAS